MLPKQISQIFLPHPAFARSPDLSNSTCAINDVATIGDIECLFANILQAIMPIASLVFFAMFIAGGFKYLTAGGDPKKMATASRSIAFSFFAIIGVIASWFILLFIEKFTGVNVTQFKISD